MKGLCSAVCIGAMLSGCAPAHIRTVAMPPEADRSSVLIYRDSEFNAMGAQMVFGMNDDDLASLGTKSYSKLFLVPGTYNLFVRSTGGDQPYVVQLALAGDEQKCLRGYPNPTNLAKPLLPLSYVLGNTFLIKQVECPADEILRDYWFVPIEYAH